MHIGYEYDFPIIVFKNSKNKMRMLLIRSALRSPCPANHSPILTYLMGYHKLSPPSPYFFYPNGNHLYIREHGIFGKTLGKKVFSACSGPFFCCGNMLKAVRINRKTIQKKGPKNVWAPQMRFFYFKCQA